MTGDLTRWRKKPVEIEAMRWDGSRSSIQDICDWANTDLTDDPCVTYEFHGDDDVVGNPIIGTLEGDMTVSPGDWIIRGVKGEFYPCKPDVFEATYELVLDADPDTPTADAPVDDGLVEQIARVLAEHRWSVNRWACLCGWTPEPRPGRDKSGVVRHGERNSHDAHLARALVVARPRQAEVDAARQDALNKAADEIAREAKTHPHTISESAHRVWLAGMDHAARVVVRLRERAARGETRQP